MRFDGIDHNCVAMALRRGEWRGTRAEQVA
jgi:hypothetical protein